MLARTVDKTGMAIPMLACLAVAACAATPTPPAAPASPPAPKPASSLSISLGDESGNAKTVQLNCEPAGGTHPSADTACAALDAAGGDPAALRPRNQMCTMESHPVTGRVTGTWRGKHVEFARTYGNSCQAGANSGGLFDLS